MFVNSTGCTALMRANSPKHPSGCLQFAQRGIGIRCIHYVCALDVHTGHASGNVGVFTHVFRQVIENYVSNIQVEYDRYALHNCRLMHVCECV